MATALSSLRRKSGGLQRPHGFPIRLDAYRGGWRPVQRRCPFDGASDGSGHQDDLPEVLAGLEDAVRLADLG